MGIKRLLGISALLTGSGVLLWSYQQTRSAPYVTQSVVDCAGGTAASCPVPIGKVNGTNKAFTLSTPSLGSASIKVFRNGLRLFQIEDYSLSRNTAGATVLSLTKPPNVGDHLLVDYQAEFSVPTVCSNCVKGQP